ncbi:uracil-DNA glycosylase family protein [Alteromonas sp. ASW11-130]|uniref:uracil-DNA glycosylase family protein n=1 Tax=Alteromonas sp. ASW11-130 TaxID=3015775 RepID=UPI002241C2AF|nr:uracil-DNA glycosylase family protein [Alteromonas sp. ASW11-130]MCW8092699.1 uracil-DNA glycosylase family protein [Alteromonas sp. ASW11-130]
MKIESFDKLVERAKRCTVCEAQLPQPPRPVFTASETAKIVIIGQAPGIKAHDSATPWNDASGDRLRAWTGIPREVFYSVDTIALIPMGFCFPGYKNGADAPPRKECAPIWHKQLISRIAPELIILAGRYAQQYYLPHYKTLTEAVAEHNLSQSNIMVLPHPSGRNNRWLTKNPWFTETILPRLKMKVDEALETKKPSD